MIMKKTVKSNPLKTFNDNKALAVKKMGGAQAAFKKSLPKAQPGVSVGTPFQGYLKNNPGAVASDTIMKTIYPNSSWDAPKNPVAKNPKNQGVLEKMFEKTYGQNWKSESGQPSKGETFEGYKRRMGPLKKGGTVKALAIKKTGGATKATKFAALAPPYNKATFADRIVGAKKNARKKK
jgi:hypothetical protein